VKEATREYQEENDLLGRFLELCVETVAGETVGATPFHRLFAAWQTWAGQLPASGKPWSMKHLNTQMQRKGFKISKSSTMQWQGVALRYDPGDFCEHDAEGKILRAVERELPPARTLNPPPADGSPSAARPSPHPFRGDDDPGVPF
jgi:putative DNA primase/helicase